MIEFFFKFFIKLSVYRRYIIFFKMNKPKLLDCSHHKMTNIVRFNEYNP